MTALGTLPAPPVAPPIAAPVDEPRLYRLSVQQYQQMGRLGILTTQDQVELLEGLLVEKMTKHSPHIFATEALRDILPPLLPSGWHVNCQEPVTTDDSIPEPDSSVIRGTRRAMAARGVPSAADVGMVAEVSDSTLAVDRGLMKTIYARANIAIYWIVNLVDRQVEVYTDPTGPIAQPDYRQRQGFGITDAVPLVLDGKEVARIPVRDLLP